MHGHADLCYVLHLSAILFNNVENPFSTNTKSVVKENFNYFGVDNDQNDENTR